MIKYTLVISIVLSTCLYSCMDEKASPASAQKFASIVWSLDSISTQPNRKSYITWSIKNESSQDWAPTEWSLHFNQIAGGLVEGSLPDFVIPQNPAGDYVIAQFNDKLDTIKAGQSLRFQYQMSGIIERMSNAPCGIFIVHNNEVHDIKDVTIEGINHKTLAAINPVNAFDRYEQNKSLTLLSADKVVKVFPTPQNIEYKEGELRISSTFSISYSDKNLNDEVSLFKENFAKYFNGNITEQSDQAILNIQIANDSGIAESYRLSITNEQIQLSGADEAGIFYGLMTLLNMIDPAQLNHPLKDVALPALEITDYPRFAYRGYMLDVARNFHKKDKVLEILDLMSQYKLNKFHFHLIDDEGWRLEIPGLPELTSVGSVRGYTPDESDRLFPFYGSGGVAENSYSTGYYTVANYQEIIRYANARHIEVIPEIDLPGHARAAIISMRNRYNRLIKEGKEQEALEYVLHDPDDQSQYVSAQNYNDNVINLCQGSAYTFIEKVLEETIKMHVDAGVPLKTIHTGGDEVPFGAWRGSPICQSFISDMENLSGTEDLHPNMLYFIRKILNKYNITTAGWEEIALAHTDQGHNGTLINEKLIGEPMLPYVWNAQWGSGREDMVYKLANAGFDVVMCNSASYYFDLAYDSDPREGGLDWSGLTDAKTAFDLEPLDMFKYANNSNPDDFNSKVRLNPESRSHFLGIQAELWSETIHKADLVDYMTFPKLFGLAERSWGKSIEESGKSYNENYNDFVNTIGQRELTRLDNYSLRGVQYRIPPPGIKIEGNKVYANTTYPSLQIRYTIDGSEPTITSTLYEGEFSTENPELIRAKCFSSNGRSSRESVVY